jgi:hypothetical protein
MQPWLLDADLRVDEQFADKGIFPGFIDPYLHPSLGAAQTAAAGAPDLLVVEASGVAQLARLSRLLRGVAGTLPARCLTVVNLSRADRLATHNFVSRLFR